MERKYISDIISEENIKGWLPGDKIVINSPTGSGKSVFVKTKLAKFAREKDVKILLLTNRNILKDQVILEIQNDPAIRVLNYQGLTKIIKESEFDFSQYQYVVCDECHFFFTDSYFNSETDISLDYLTNLKDNITLFLSATCETFKGYMKDKNTKYYVLDNALNCTEMYYFFNRKTITSLLENLPENEKAIYFCSNIENAYALHKRFEDRSSFICSENNRKYSQLSNEYTRNKIVEDAKFDRQILFTTKILDNGVNIKDRSLKHIITDIFDFDTIQQCIGRKRILDENDKINIYIKQFKQNSIQSYLNQWNKTVMYGNYFLNMERDEYVKLYGRQNTNGLIYAACGNSGMVLKLNEAFYYKLNSDIKDCQTITEYHKNSCQRLGHLQILCNRYKINIDQFKNLDDTITTDVFTEQLSKFMDVKMFKEEQKQFKAFIKENAVKTVAKTRSALGINTINGYFEDNKILYGVSSYKETSGENRGRRYWKLYKKI